MASFQATGTARRVRAGIAFSDASGKVTRLGSSNASTVDATTGWMTSAYTAVAPAGTVSAQAFIMVENTVVGESHLLDRLGLVAGTATEGLTGLSSGTYQVVATAPTRRRTPAPPPSPSPDPLNDETAGRVTPRPFRVDQ
ncbi:MAG TPA: hypothetical protein VN408_08390 [Actinoplanes sp.]|nr:hypothetical protein [Actinoplanes sp.]